MSFFPPAVQSPTGTPGDGSFTCTPNAGLTGTDSFTYEITDGALPSTPVAVAITV
jgi:large repetitive protein